MAQTAMRSRSGGSSLRLAAADGATSSNPPLRSHTGGSFIARLDVIIAGIDQATGPTRSGGSTRIIGNQAYTWRYTVRKLAMLARLPLGWDYATSKPMNPLAEANYLEWLSGIPADRLGDAEPMLTDDGFIRLEWRRDGYARIAEIGPASLFMASLTPNPQDDVAVEVDRFDSTALSRFFALGVIGDQ